MSQQTYKGKMQWLVVDDHPVNPAKLTLGQELVKAPMWWNPEVNTQRPNMSALLEKVKGDVCLVIEDDEFYAPDYIASMLKLLEVSQVAGLSSSKYYHLHAPGFKTLDNTKHAPLCHTALRKEALPLLYEAVHSGHYYFDIELWKKAQAREIPCALLSNTTLSIGIKGMPGRAGLGTGHELVGYQGDRDLTMLKKWLGEDHKYYLPFIKK
jgi:hypothetical protein